MRVFIRVKANRYLPNKDELVAAMWKPGIAHSFIGKKPVYALKFDKWLENPALGDIPCPHIEFEMDTKIKQPNNYVIAELDDDAPFVDVRAFHMAILFIANRQRTKGKVVGKVSFDGNVWITPEQYGQMVITYVSCSFDEAMERTIKSYLD